MDLWAAVLPPLIPGVPALCPPSRCPLSLTQRSALCTALIIQCESFLSSSFGKTNRKNGRLCKLVGFIVPTLYSSKVSEPLKKTHCFNIKVRSANAANGNRNVRINYRRFYQLGFIEGETQWLK